MTHEKAQKENYDKLLKQNTQLHARINFYKKVNEDLVKNTNIKLGSVIKTYDRHNEKVLEYLIKNKLINDEQRAEVINLFPMKLP